MNAFILEYMEYICFLFFVTLPVCPLGRRFPHLKLLNVSETMEGLYHQTNALLEQTQGYFVRLEQGAMGEDGMRLQQEIQVAHTYISCYDYNHVRCYSQGSIPCGQTLRG